MLLHYALFSALILLIILSIKPSVQAFGRIKRRSWLILLVIVLIGALLRLLLPHAHLIYIDESWYMESTNRLISSGKLELCEYTTPEKQDCMDYPKSSGWPLILSVLFKIFGAGSGTALYASSAFGILSIAIFFAIAYILTQSENTAIISAALLSLFPQHILWSLSAETHVVAIFFSLLTLLLTLLYLRAARPIFLYTASIAFMIASLMRIELILLLIPIAAAFIAYKARPSLHWLYAGIITIGASSLLYVPDLIRQNSLQQSIYDAAYFSPAYYFTNIPLLAPSLALIAVMLLGSAGLFYMKSKDTAAIIAWLVTFLFLYLSFIKFQGRLLLLPAVIMLMPLASLIGDKRWRYPAISAVLILFIMLSVQSHNFMAPQYILETSITGESIDKDCIVLAAFPTVLVSTGHEKTVSFVTYYRDPGSFDNSSCLLLYEDGFCLKSPVAGDGRAPAMCRLIKAQRDWKEQAAFNQGNVTYRLLR